MVEPALRAFAPELILVASGFDASILDPLARQMVTSAGFQHLTHRMLEIADGTCAGRIAFVQRGVTAARREWHIDRVTVSVARATLLPVAGLRRETEVLVDRDGQHRGILVPDVLGTVAVVDVPVDHGDAPHTENVFRVGGRHRDVVEDAEAHAGSTGRVVPRRIDQRVTIVDRPVEHLLDERDRAARRKRGDLVPAPAEGRDAVAGVSALRLQALGLDPFQVLRRVHSQYVGLGGGHRFDRMQLLQQAGHRDQFVESSFGIGVCEVVADRLETGRDVGREQTSAARVGPPVKGVPHISGCHGDS